MLTKVFPGNVQQHWPHISRYIRPVLPPTMYESDESMNNMLSSLLDGSMQLWLLHDENRPHGVVITAIQLDSCTGVKTLVIYVFSWMTPLDDGHVELYSTGLDSLKRYAKGQGCLHVCAYSNVPEAIELAASLGADVEHRYIMFPISSD